MKNRSSCAVSEVQHKTGQEKSSQKKYPTRKPRQHQKCFLGQCRTLCELLLGVPPLLFPHEHWNSALCCTAANEACAEHQVKLRSILVQISCREHKIWIYWHWRFTDLPVLPEVLKQYTSIANFEWNSHLTISQTGLEIKEKKREETLHLP